MNTVRYRDCIALTWCPCLMARGVLCIAHRLGVDGTGVLYWPDDGNVWLVWERGEVRGGEGRSERTKRLPIGHRGACASMCKHCLCWRWVVSSWAAFSRIWTCNQEPRCFFLSLSLSRKKKGVAERTSICHRGHASNDVRGWPPSPPQLRCVTATRGRMLLSCHKATLYPPHAGLHRTPPRPRCR